MRCPLCRCPTEPGALECEVCRAQLTDVDPGPPVEESDRPRRLFSSMPSPLALLAFALVCLWWWEPITRPFNVPNVHSGWSASATLNRRAELLDATYEITFLVDELGTAARAGKVLDARWGRQLSQVRLRWRLTGSTSGRFAPMEQELLEIILECAAIRSEMEVGPGPGSLVDRVDALRGRLQNAERELSDGS